LVSLKPPAERLTTFYVVLSIGGALGGAMVSLVAPRIFTGYYEFNAGLIACLMLLLMLRRRDRWLALPAVERRRRQWGATLVLVAIAAGTMGAIRGISTLRPEDDQIELAAARNFYGCLRIVRFEANDSSLGRTVMVHGNTTHGVQFESAQRRREPTMYYRLAGGAGLAIEQHPVYVRAERPLRVGVVGLGCGTLASYARPGDCYRYYEIDPLVIDLAEASFSFLSDARERGADVLVHPGDARIVLQRQLDARQPQAFDVLVVDAFNSDSIPLHLITRECFDLYRAHLADGGLLAVHVSNRHLDLRGVVAQMAFEAGQSALWIHCDEDPQAQGREFGSASDWMLVTSNQEFLARGAVLAAEAMLPADLPRATLTDDFGSLFQLLRH
ncbi:MAG: fused MFS/spermidine synthase, partial [Planctomycetales bacterium]|nr:fused MFS/spermidine synthase [Planctomycetales bacterium]